MTALLLARPGDRITVVNGDQLPEPLTVERLKSGRSAAVERQAMRATRNLINFFNGDSDVYVATRD